CAVILLALSIGAALRESKSPYRRLGVAALAMFVISSLTNDTVNSDQLVAAAGLFTALAAPSSARPSWENADRRPRMAIAFAVAGGIAVAYLLALQAATTLHATAVAAAESGNPGDAVGKLQLAVALDPANGFYWRELGLSRLAEGDFKGSAEAFEYAAT